MSYQITKGILEGELSVWLKDAAQKFGKFDDGRINYKNAFIAPIVMCTIVCKNELLLVKRGFGLADAEGYWSTVNGFIDEVRPVWRQAQQEALEELGLTVSKEMIRVAKSYTLQNPKEVRQYIVFPCLISLEDKPDVVLDREHTDFAWITRGLLETYDILEDLPYAIDAALSIA